MRSDGPSASAIATAATVIRARRGLAVSDESTRLKDMAPAHGAYSRFEERLALFIHSLDRTNAAQLLEGLAPRQAERAGRYLRELGRVASAERQGRLSAEFGARPDAPERLRDLWAEAGSLLRQDIYRLLPPYYRTLFPNYSTHPGTDEEANPARQAFADRLIREATG